MRSMFPWKPWCSMDHAYPLRNNRIIQDVLSLLLLTVTGPKGVIRPTLIDLITFCPGTLFKIYHEHKSATSRFKYLWSQ